MAECLTCHEPITDAKRKTKVYCSNACKSAAYYSRVKERPVKRERYSKRAMLNDISRIGEKSAGCATILREIVALASKDNAELAIAAVFHAFHSLGHNYNYDKGIWE